MSRPKCVRETGLTVRQQCGSSVAAMRRRCGGNVAALHSNTGGRARALDELGMRYGEVEAGMALRRSDRDARLEIARPAASDALLPGLDRARTVWLVTLPGAFVGTLLGGASPLEAGVVRVFVLVSLPAVQAVAVALVLELVARGRLHRG